MKVFNPEVGRYVKFEALGFDLFEETQSIVGGLRKFDIYFGIFNFIMGQMFIIKLS